MKDCMKCEFLHKLNGGKILYCHAISLKKCLYGEHTLHPYSKSEINSIRKKEEEKYVEYYVPRYKSFPTKPALDIYWEPLHDPIFMNLKIFNGNKSKVSEKLNIPYSSLLFYLGRYKETDSVKYEQKKRVYIGE